jgi:hypothetical protein
MPGYLSIPFYSVSMPQISANNETFSQIPCIPIKTESPAGIAAAMKFFRIKGVS